MSDCSSNTLVIQIITLLCLLFSEANCVVSKYPAVFNFGDSNSDTGDLVAARGGTLDPPNGKNYFKAPSGRFCDGRLVIDFLSNALIFSTHIMHNKYAFIMHNILPSYDKLK